MAFGIGVFPCARSQILTGGHRHPHAVRILARTWLLVIWRCWKDPNQPDQYRALQLLRTTTDAA